jgi:Flp pilus assembly protein TadG
MRRTTAPALLGQRLARNVSGNVAIIFALALPVVLGAVAAAIEYGTAIAQRSKMQAVADAAAISSAREFQLALARPDKIEAAARNYVAGQLADVAIQALVDPKALTVRVTLEKYVEMTLGKMLSSSRLHLRVNATARMSSGLPLCLLALDPKVKGAITLQANARLTAPSCLVQSNSKNPGGLVSKDDAVLQAGYICSAGGKVKTKDTNYSPQPTTDCPVIPDPLSARGGLLVSACNHTDKVVDGETATLSPGVYCGGLTVTNRAQVTLSPGIFIFRDGPLTVHKGSSFKGANVSLYMKGAGANLTFAAASSISLTAPKDGPLAGLLIFDDTTGAAAPEKSGKHAKLGKSPREHSILSDDARTLIGTIYMPKGRLIIDATKPIADRSAYTVLVLQQLDLYDGPNLHLNSDYSASDIPLPQGVGPYGGKVSLTN